MIDLGLKKILITGSAGFLGRNIYNYLAENGNDVIGLVHEKEVKGQNTLRGDVMNIPSLKKALRNVDRIVHCAALVGGNWPKNRYLINSKGTRNVLKTAIDLDVSQVVYISSLAVVDEFIDHFNDDENIPYTKKYRNHYTQSKITAEKYALERRSKLKMSILRPGWIWGPGDKSIESLFLMIKNKRFAFIGNGENLTYFTYIDNICQAIGLALEKKEIRSGQIFNITDGMKITMSEFVNSIASEIGVKPVTKKIPASLSYALAYIIEHVKPSSELTRQNVAIMSKNLHFSTARAEKLLGYKPDRDLKKHVRTVWQNIKKIRQV